MVNYRDYVICIEKRGDGESEVLGTGFPVSENMVLTARHVVEGIDAQDLDLKLSELPRQESRVSGKKIHYFGCGDENDYAIIEFEDSIKQLPLVFFSKKTHLENDHWSSFGFPLMGSYKDENGNIIDRGIGLKGQFYGAQSDSPTQQLHEDGSCPHRRWKGVSGAPVMTCYESKLAGIIIFADKDSDGKRLEMLCSFHMLENEGFRKLCGIDEQANEKIESSLDRLNESLLGALQRSGKPLKSTIVNELKHHNIEFASTDEQGIANALCSQCEHQLAIAAINTAYRNAQDACDLKTMREARDLSGYIASILLGSTEALRMAESGVLGVVDIAVPNSTLAEACMACLDGRPAEYSAHGGSLTGKLAIPVPPESDKGESLFSFRKVLEELDEKLLVRGRQKGKKLSNDVICLKANHFLRKRKCGTRPRTYYLVLPESADLVAREIEEKISEMVCIRLAGGAMELADFELITEDLYEINQSDEENTP